MRIVIGIAAAIATWILARRKGFNPWLWLLAAGIPGFVILLFLPSPLRAPDDDTRRRRQLSGDMLGLMLTGLAVGFLLTLLTWVDGPDKNLFGKETALQAFIGLVYILLNLVAIILLGQSLRGGWKYLFIFVSVVSYGIDITSNGLFLLDSQSFNAAYRSDSGLIWHVLQPSLYYAIVRGITLLRAGAVLLFALAAYETAHGHVRLPAARSSAFTAQILGCFLVPVVMALGLGALSKCFVNYHESMTTTAILTREIHLIWILWGAIAAVLLARRLGIAWWSVAALALPTALFYVVDGCALAFDFDWLRDNLLGLADDIPRFLRASLLSGMQCAYTLGLLFIAIHFSQALSQEPENRLASA